MSGRGRWPGWVFREGQEPDYRFSFANERTFLAWIRTSLALLASAVAVDAVDLDIAVGMRRLLAGILVTLGFLAAVVSWLRWATAERAVRRGAPLPSMGFALVIGLGLVVVALLVLVATL
jgi:putative membrane protein